ncbi:MAG: ATP-binding cassette domain-containing protein [Mycoplasmataceae bacterium]|jgi:energy-coupling factor transport system ATP-binding protein|nr:ATP-binding cassette domain-containing protein [Mycoplasmataceae bacterium]
MQSKKIISQETSPTPNENNIAFEIKDITIVLNKNTPVQYTIIENLSYKFEKGKIYYICGPAGCGKTLLITHFNGLMIPEKGEIFINNEKMIVKKGKIKNVKKVRKQIGMVFQFAEYQLFKSTIEKDIMFGPLNFGIKKARAKELAAEKLKLVGMDEVFLKRNPFGLSGGQKRRVAIAGVLASDPDILVFDEPSAGLDPNGEKEILGIITKLKEMGKTIIVVTHVLDHALEVADKLLVINEKKIAKEGDVYDIFLDTELTKNTQLSTPKIIKIIFELMKKDKKYNKLYDLKPRTVKELVTYIKEINYEEK